MLLSFSRQGSLPLTLIGERLQVHPASVTGAVAKLEAQGLVVLEDDKQLQNADNLVPVVNAEGPAGSDEVAEILNGLSETLTTEDLAELNRRVDEDREQAADVAKDYLTEKGLLEA